MQLTVRHLGQATVEAIESTMQEEIRKGQVELTGKRVINTVTFKRISDPVKFVGERASDSDHSHTLHALARRMARQLRTKQPVG